MSEHSSFQFPRLSLVTPALLCLLIFYGVRISPHGLKSERDLLALTAGDHLPIYYLHKIEFSARFYSAARARLLAIDAVSVLQGDNFYLAVPHHLKNQATLKALSLEWLGDNRRYGLYRSR